METVLFIILAVITVLGALFIGVAFIVRLVA